MPTNQTVAIPPFNDIQRAIYVAFKDEIDAQVYDNVPEDKTRPWVTIGEAVGSPDNWHGGFGWDITSTFHVWTQSLGYKPALAIAAQMIAIIDHRLDSLDIGDEWQIVAIRFMNLATMRDPDPEIRHVPVQFQVVVHQQEV